MVPAHHLRPRATYLLKKSLEDTGDIMRRVSRQFNQHSAILKGLAQSFHTHSRPTDPIDTLQAKGAMLYLSCAPGNHKGYLLREVSGEL